MNDPHLICVACELAEATLQQPYCDSCKQQLQNAGLLEPDTTTDEDPPKVQIGPTDI